MPEEALLAMKVLTSAPEMATIAPPRAKASADRLRTLMPERPAAIGSIAMARSAVPKRGLRMTRIRAPPRTIAAANASSRFAGKLAPKTWTGTDRK